MKKSHSPGRILILMAFSEHQHLGQEGVRGGEGRGFPVRPGDAQVGGLRAATERAAQHLQQTHHPPRDQTQPHHRFSHPPLRMQCHPGRLSYQLLCRN